MEIDIPFDLSFLDDTTYAPKSLVHPPNDSNVAATHSTMNHFLSLDFLSLTSNYKDAFCIALALLESTSQIHKAKAFILEASIETSIFSSMDCNVNLTRKSSPNWMY